MGILHSITRVLGCKTEDEEGERQIYPYPILHPRQNRYPYNSDSSRSSERLPKLYLFHSLICKAIKGLWQTVRFIFYLPRPRKTTDPILPIQNPAPSISIDPLLVQTPPISSLSNDSSAVSTPESGPTTFAPLADINIDDQELQCDNVEIVSSQQWPEEENYSANRNMPTDHMVISIPDFTYSFAYTSASEEIMDSAVFLEEIAPQDVPFLEESMGMNSSAGKGEEEEEEEEEKVMTKSIVVVGEGRWIKHYSSRHRILLVGEGDFSFSASLAVAFGLAYNMIATSLDSKAFLKKNYQYAPINIEELRSRECKVMHGIDATKMANHALLGQLKFDRIIFNFPFAGFFKNLSREAQLRRHRRLVSMFLKNAREMISENGEIHISHKTNDFHIEWKLESVASSHKLRLIEAVIFDQLDYPGYNTKCGFGTDNNFNCNPSKTYKFGLKWVRY
ncbi:hypothetical protein Pfo_013429 [Paulownia fortunei]|nr:hypothetical protein Pfo_013429 [Paulownia fortunei]